MNLRAGILLKSIDNTGEPHFEETIVFLAEHNEKGAMGFIVNKLFPRRLNELVEFKNAPAFPLYYGGPVGEEQLFFIHRRPDIIKGGVIISGNIFSGGDFKEAVSRISDHTLFSKDIQIFIGYCGWDAGQLEEEIGNGGWEILKESGIAMQELGIRNWEDH